MCEHTVPQWQCHFQLNISVSAHIDTHYSTSRPDMCVLLAGARAVWQPRHCSAAAVSSAVNTGG